LGKRLGEMLVDEGIINPEQLQEVVEEQQTKGGRLESILVSHGFVTEEVLLAFVGTQLGIPQVNLDQIGEIPQEVMASVPQSLAIKYCFIPIVKKENKVTIAISDPLNV